MRQIASRASVTLVSLAEYLLTVDVGEVLPPRVELAARAGAGVGTLERAFDSLLAAGAVEVDGVQRAGTTVLRLDYAALWGLAGRSILRGQLPLNVSVEMQAIEVALASAFSARGLEVAMVYQEGAGRRLDAVGRGLSDFAVMSGHAAGALASSEIVPVLGFGPGSYYGTAGLYRLMRKGREPVARVGVDTESPDHRLMVGREFPGAEAVPTPFRLIPPQIVAGALDATVWFGGMALAAQYMAGLRAQHITGRRGDPLMSSEAVVVAAGGSAVQHLLLELDGELLMKTFDHVASTGGEGATP